MKKHNYCKLLILLFLPFLHGFSPLSAQEQESDPYTVDFESDYNCNAVRPEWPCCWIIYSYNFKATDHPYHGSQHLKQPTNSPEMKIYSCYFDAQVSDTFSFYFRMNSGGAPPAISNYKPYIGYMEFGDAGNLPNGVTWFDTLDMGDYAYDQWVQYSNHFPVEGNIRIVFFADQAEYGNWLQSPSSHASFDYFRTNADPIYHLNPNVDMIIESGSPTACSLSSRTFKAQNITNYSDPFTLEWYVKKKGSGTYVYEHGALSRTDTTFSTATLQANDTVMVRLRSYTSCSAIESFANVWDSSFFVITECREINLTGKNKTGVCPEESLRFDFSASPAGNWPDGNATKVHAQISAPGIPDWSNPDTLTGGAVNLSNGSLTGAFPTGTTPNKYYIRLIANDPIQTSSANFDSVILYPLPDTSLIETNDVTTCQGDTTLLSIHNTEMDVRYILSSGVTPVDTIFGDGTDQTLKVWATSNTTLTINATNINTKCVSNANRDIQARLVPKPVATPNNFSLYYEADTTIYVNVSGGTPPYEFSWEPDSLVSGQDQLETPNTLAMHESQYIYVSVTDLNQCVDSAYAYINVKGSPLQVVIEGSFEGPNPDAGQPADVPYNMDGHQNNTSMCQGDSIYLSAMLYGGSETYNIEWRKVEDGISLVPDNPYIIVVSPPVPSLYILIVDDGETEKRDTFYIQQIFEIAPALAQPDTFLFPDAEVQLQGTLLPPGNPTTASYRWEPAAFVSNPDISNPMVSIGNERTDFILTVTDENGCISADTASIQFREFQLYVPSAFSPNDDGINDSIAVRGFGIDEILFRIYNRWGELVFETDQWNPASYRSASWNGVYKGEMQHQQTLGYFVRAKTIAGDQYEETGTITIIK